MCVVHIIFQFLSAYLPQSKDMLSSEGLIFIMIECVSAHISVCDELATCTGCDSHWEKEMG